MCVLPYCAALFPFSPCPRISYGMAIASTLIKLNDVDVAAASRGSEVGGQHEDPWFRAGSSKESRFKAYAIRSASVSSESSESSENFMMITGALSSNIADAFQPGNILGRTSRYLVVEQTTLLTKRSSSKAPIIAGTIFGVVGVILMGLVIWFFLRRRQERDKELVPDLVSRPFPLRAPRTPRPSATASPHIPSPVFISDVVPYKPRRTVPPPPQRSSRPRKDAPILRSSISKPNLDSHLPPISEGYGVGLQTLSPQHDRTRQDIRTRRASISKSYASSDPHLPPISQGYGVGLLTREGVGILQPLSGR
ncbi:hypothetical protein B0H10DRAFT_1999999 [Mycena sp. CBHHK59/15]|nr:hypothetical protein B0H10DRAFT_1999999 [Mycena sp. CBHHK59/15]